VSTLILVLVLVLLYYDYNYKDDHWIGNILVLVNTSRLPMRLNHDATYTNTTVVIRTMTATKHHLHLADNSKSF